MTVSQHLIWYTPTDIVHREARAGARDKSQIILILDVKHAWANMAYSG